LLKSDVRNAVAAAFDSSIVVNGVFLYGSLSFSAMIFDGGTRR
jgi:hypothetical protein